MDVHSTFYIALALSVIVIITVA